MAIFIINALPFYVDQAFTNETIDVVNSVRPPQVANEWPSFETVTRSLNVSFSIPVGVKADLMAYTIGFNLLENASQFLSIKNYENPKFYKLPINVKFSDFRPELICAYLSPYNFMAGGIVSSFTRSYSANNTILNVSVTFEPLVLDDFNRMPEVINDGEVTQAGLKQVAGTTRQIGL